MIVRELSDGSVILVNQSDHAKLSGFMAAHWGNKNFDRARPYDSAVRAAMFHDVAWYKYETGPKLNPETKKPMGFMHVPLTEDTLGTFQWASDWMSEIDPYSGLLMRKHRNGIWLGRYGVISHPVAFNNKNMTPLMQAFVDHNEALRKKGEAATPPDFDTNYHLLQIWDLLSLYFCTQSPKDDYLEPVPTRYGDGGKIVKMDLKVLSPERVSIDPYPFDIPELPVEVMHRHLSKSVFADESEFRQAYYQAPLKITKYSLVPA